MVLMVFNGKMDSTTVVVVELQEKTLILVMV
jgi:hypothetical protein